MDRRSHWENVYHTKHATEVSWFEAEPTTSLTLIRSVAPGGGRIIDIGGGASLLVDRLAAVGNWDMTVLDVSATALEVAQARRGERHRTEEVSNSFGIPARCQLERRNDGHRVTASSTIEQIKCPMSGRCSLILVSRRSLGNDAGQSLSCLLYAGGTN